MSKKAATLQDLAALTQSTLIGNPLHVVVNVADLETAAEDDISFLSNPRYDNAMRRSKAGAVFIDPKTALLAGRNFLIHENPSVAFQQAIEFFHGSDQEFSGFRAIHPTAVIHPTAQLASDVVIGPLVVIDKEVRVGRGTQILAQCSIGPHTTIGEDCLLFAGVKVREKCIIGNRVTLQPGAVIGSCGYGYTQDKLGRHSKLKQLGNVVIEDDVEIGANATIDRARFKTTRIRRGTKIDNLVQIAHGVEIGEDNLIIAQTGIAGSAKTGARVIIAGQVAIAGHLEIESGAMIAARSGVDKSLKKPGKYGGIPARPLDEHNRAAVHLKNIEKHVEKIKELEARLQALEDLS